MGFLAEDIMDITLKSVKLINFKGIKDLEITFNPEMTNISGDNGKGKTTVYDAVLWLLFGKDSYETKDLNIKTFNKNNVIIPKIDHEVTGIFDIDGANITFKKCLKESWVKSRGETEQIFKGNETLYSYNDVLMKAVEYEAKINEFIIEYKFKILTNVNYFANLTWNKRRQILTDVAGDVSDNEIIEGNEDYKSVFATMNEQRLTLEQLRASLSAKKKKSKDELIQILPRIEEVNRVTPESPNYVELETNIKETEQRIKTIEDNILDRTQTSQQYLNKKIKIQNRINVIETALNQLLHVEKITIQNHNNGLSFNKNNLSNLLSGYKDKLKDTDTSIETNNKTLITLNTKIETLRAEFKNKNEEELTFDETKFSCPTCKRAYDNENIEQKKEDMLANFNTEKSNSLAEINATGVVAKLKIENLTKLNKDLTDKKALIEVEITKLTNEINSLPVTNTFTVTPDETIKQKLLANNAEYKAQANELTITKKELSELVVIEVDVTDLTKQKDNWKILLDELKREYFKKDTIETNTKRIEELKEREKVLSQEISSYEKTEFAILNFTKEKSERISAKVNAMFKNVQFKLFKTLINGSEEPCCDIIVEGVPYNNGLNTGGKINTGLEIIKVLSDYYNIHCFCFVDNAESISNPLRLNSQMILLRKVEGQKTLVIN